MADSVSTLRVLVWSIAAVLLLVTLGPHLIRYVALAARRLASRFTWRGGIAGGVGVAAVIAHARYRPWPEEGENVILDLVAATDPAACAVLFWWSLALPGLAAGMTVLGASGAWRLWIAGPGRARRSRGLLPPWPDEDPAEPRLVIGELHHPTEGREIEKPSWLVLDERGLYTGIAIFGAIGTGKTSACMNPFARQLFGWQAADPAKRAAGLVLEVKGDFYHKYRYMIAHIVPRRPVPPRKPCARNAIRRIRSAFTGPLLCRVVQHGIMEYWFITDTQVGNTTCENDRLRPPSWLA